MGRIKKVLAAAMIATMSISMAGCNMISKTQESIQKTVLAKIGDEKIRLSDVDAELKVDIDNLKSTYGDDWESNISDTLKEQLLSVRQQVLETLIEEKVLLLKADELGLVPDEETLAADVEEQTEQLKEYYGGDDEFASALETYGYTDETFNEFMRNQVIVEAVKEYMLQDVTVTDEEIETYYNDNIDSYTTTPSATCDHILFETEEEAQAAKDKIDSGESTFDEIFDEYSANASSGTYPLSESLGTVEYDSTSYDTDFMAGFSELGEGEVSGPVESSYGYHLIRATDKSDETVVTPLDDVKDTIESTLLSEKQTEVYDSTLEQWKTDLNVKTYEDRLE